LLRACQHGPGFATEGRPDGLSTVVTVGSSSDRLACVAGRSRSRRSRARPHRPRHRDVVVARDEAPCRARCLEAMPGRQAAVLWAVRSRRLSYDEIAERFRLSERRSARCCIPRAAHPASASTPPVAAPAGGGIAILARGGVRSAARQVDALGRQSVTAASVTLRRCHDLRVSSSLPTLQAARSRSGRPWSTRVAQSKSSTPGVSGPRAVGTMPPRRLDRPAPPPDTRPEPRRHAPTSRTGSSTITTCARRHASHQRTDGINCTPYQAKSVLIITRPLPHTPTDVNHIGVGSKIDCSNLPKIPFTRCDTQPFRELSSTMKPTTCARRHDACPARWRRRDRLGRNARHGEPQASAAVPGPVLRRRLAASHLCVDY